MENYGILLVVADPVHRAILSAILTAGGEDVEGVDQLSAARDAVRSRRRDLFILDLDPVDSDALIRDIRAGSASVPIITFEPVEQADATLPKPLRLAELTALLRRWLGEDRMLASPDRQGEKLAALLGAEQAAAMIGRFQANLAEAVEQIEAGGDARAIGHRVGGLAGMLGFDVMRAAWLGIEEHGMAAWPTVRTLTLEAIERHQRTPGT